MISPRSANGANPKGLIEGMKTRKKESRQASTNEQEESKRGPSGLHLRATPRRLLYLVSMGAMPIPLATISIASIGCFFSARPSQHAGRCATRRLSQAPQVTTVLRTLTN
ncbi:uncharacterized protein BO95DRAFT_217222 [Aspergillus brunneoviolaceus CBS 621.78]|uniref:Uncharacterized protein n=1 Tax=Aspergillus brunneoviolaceus CBS 621.78 TaxID=1450534 RepID=A0ACD1G113_9EURO|nr:hypothetical protein BO95DRAFT_217222 [Aspergillus brunneoviolaceus CBS 621.78]RAH42930.1 hypothetical protein BO95DRAFT_217222 [Aspergillus brunneoviolaceus CBS 621.78]